MKELILPTYTELDNALAKTALKLHSSQVHGIVAGLLCGKPVQGDAWQQIITGGETNQTAQAILDNLYKASHKQLADFLFEFQLLLPEAQSNLTERAEGLTLWCQGFLTGLKLAEIPIVGRKASEVTEAINDLIEIAKMNYEEVVASEEDEAAYVELIEYVRMAVILIYQDLQEDQGKDQKTLSKHLH